MPKFDDFTVCHEVKDVVERYLVRFSEMFEGFDADRIGFLLTLKKKSKVPIKVHAVSYPMNVWVEHAYVFETFETWWKIMNQKQRNLAVFKAMCSIPDGGFDEKSKHYAKVLKPEIQMFMREFAASGGIPNWMENPAALDPMEREAEDMAKDFQVSDAIPGDAPHRVPMTADDVAGAGSDDTEIESERSVAVG